MMPISNMELGCTQSNQKKVAVNDMTTFGEINDGHFIEDWCNIM